MCFTKSKVPKPGAQPAPPAAAGASSLVLGPTSQDDDELRNAGVLGRLALRVGRSFGAKAGSGRGVGSGSGSGSPTPPGGVGGVGSSAPGSSPSPGTPAGGGASSGPAASPSQGPFN